MIKKNICVLMGGHTSEFDVSMNSGKGVLDALQMIGEYDFFPFTVDPHNIMELITMLIDVKPDVVFNALHGPFGEDGSIQAILEGLKIPYTHSGVTASNIAMNKSISKDLFRQHGIPTPKGGCFHFDDLKSLTLEFPLVVKPINHGSSVGVHIIKTPQEWEILIHNSWIYGKDVIVEEYIQGQDIQVGVLGDKAVGAIEVQPMNQTVYDYEAKYTKGMTNYIMPANVSKPVYDRILELGLKAHQVLGCMGGSRVDGMYCPTRDQYFILEVNTQPGLTETSLLPKISKHQGVSYDQLVRWMVEDASINREKTYYSHNFIESDINIDSNIPLQREAI
jgi:D-alanine-D-alanine ligase